MKCVVVALALLCSAQALKMENKPSSREQADRLDTKLGRPMRSKLPSKKTWVEPGEDDKEAVSDDNADIVITWAVDHGIDEIIDGCTPSTSTYDLFYCVAEGFFSSSGICGFSGTTVCSNINDDTCAQIDNYVYLAMVITSNLAEQFVASDSTFVDMNDDSIPMEKNGHGWLTESKKKDYNAAAAMAGMASGWFAASGGIQGAQDQINAWTYCDAVPMAGFDIEQGNGKWYEEWNQAKSNLGNMQNTVRNMANNGFQGTCFGGSGEGKDNQACTSVGEHFMLTAAGAAKVQQTDNWHRSFYVKTQRDKNRKLRLQGKFHRRFKE